MSIMIRGVVLLKCPSKYVVIVKRMRSATFLQKNFSRHEKRLDATGRISGPQFFLQADREHFPLRTPSEQKGPQLDSCKLKKDKRKQHAAQLKTVSVKSRWNDGAAQN